MNVGAATISPVRRTPSRVRRGAACSSPAHLLLGLPLETKESLLEGARALAHLPLDALKFHQLQIVRGTRLANQYRAAPESVPLLNPESYLDAVVDVLEHLPPQIKIQRLGSEVPPNVLVSPDWGMRLHKFPAMLEAHLLARNTWQGRLFAGDGTRRLHAAQPAHAVSVV